MFQLKSFIASYTGLTFIYPAVSGTSDFLVPSSFKEEMWRRRPGTLTLLSTPEYLITSLQMDDGHFSAIVLPQLSQEIPFDLSSCYIGVHYIPYDINVIEKTVPKAKKEELKTITKTLHHVELKYLIYNHTFYSFFSPSLSSPIKSEFDLHSLLFQHAPQPQNSSPLLPQIFLCKPSSPLSPKNTKFLSSIEKKHFNSLQLLLNQASRYDLLDQEQEFLLAQNRDHAKQLMTHSLATLLINQRHKNIPLEKLLQDLCSALKNIPCRRTEDETEKEDDLSRSKVKRCLDLNPQNFYSHASAQYKILEQFLQSDDKNISHSALSSMRWQPSFQESMFESVAQYHQEEIKKNQTTPPKISTEIKLENKRETKPENQKSHQPLDQNSLSPSLLFQTQLMQIYNLAKEQYHQTINQFILQNIRLAFTTAIPFIRQGLAPSDAVSHGILGIRKSALKYEWQRGFKFSTYASWWIKQSIERYNNEESRSIYVPIHMVDRKDEVIKSQTKFWHKHQRDPTPQELATILKLSPQQVTAVLNLPLNTLSLDQKVGDPNDRDASLLIDFIDGSDTEQLRGFVHIPKESYAFSEESNIALKIRKALSSLPPREEAILRYRNGIDTKELTLEEIGQIFNLTRERIRQIETGAEKKLHRKLEKMGINSYYFSSDKKSHT